MKYPVEMGSGAMIYIYIYTAFRKGRLAIQKLTGGYTDTQTEW
jgi:hypothetical protein